MAKAPLQLRAFMIEDYEEVLALWRATEGVGLDKSDTKEGIAAYLQRNPGLSLVAVDRTGKLVGAVMCGHDGRRGWLYHLAVAKEQRGRGLGKALVEHCVESLTRLGLLKCNLLAYTHNAAGREFWARLGFNTRGDLVLSQKTLE